MLHLTQAHGDAMLFISGTKDSLNDLTVMRGIHNAMAGCPQLMTIEGADHGLQATTKAGPSDAEISETVLKKIHDFMASRVTVE